MIELNTDQFSYKATEQPRSEKRILELLSESNDSELFFG